MNCRSPARRRHPLAALLVIAAMHTPSAAEPATEPEDTRELCRRVFDAIDEPNITFGLQGHVLRTSAYAALDRVVDFAGNCPQGTIVVVGHSDSIGDEVFNLFISRLRAQSVADYLQRGGIPADRLRVVGRGSLEPVADNGTRSGRARNRRIELRLEEGP